MIGIEGADARTRRVLGDECLLQYRGREPREIGSLLTQRQQEAGNVLGVADGTLIGLVVQSERDNPPFAEIAMEFVFTEIQLAKMLQKLGLLVRRHKLRPIGEPFRKRGQRLK